MPLIREKPSVKAHAQSIYLVSNDKPLLQELILVIGNCYGWRGGEGRVNIPTFPALEERRRKGRGVSHDRLTDQKTLPFEEEIEMLHIHTHSNENCEVPYLGTNLLAIQLEAHTVVLIF